MSLACIHYTGTDLYVATCCLKHALGTRRIHLTVDNYSILLGICIDTQCIKNFIKIFEGIFCTILMASHDQLWSCYYGHFCCQFIAWNTWNWLPHAFLQKYNIVSQKREEISYIGYFDFGGNLDLCLCQWKIFTFSLCRWYWLHVLHSHNDCW